MKDPDPTKAKQLIAEAGGVDKLAIEAVGWIWPDDLRRTASATENDAHPPPRREPRHRDRGRGALRHRLHGRQLGAPPLRSPRRRRDARGADRGAEGHRLIPKIVTGLLAHRKAGRWLNTQENTFVLLALDLYFQTYEKVTPDFVARVWLGDDYAGDHAFKGRTTEYCDDRRSR